MTLSTWSLVVFVHVLAGAMLIGSSLFGPLVLRAIGSAATLAELRGLLDLARRATRFNPLIALVLLATGVWLGREVWWVYAWFWVAVAAWVVNSALAGGVVQRAAAATSRAALLAGDGPVTAEVDRLRHSRAWHLAEVVVGANDVAILYVMIDKPTLLGSLAAVALAHLVMLGVMAAFRGSGRARGPESEALAHSPGR